MAGMIGDVDGDDRKPVFRNWLKIAKGEGMNKDDMWDRVDMIRMSSSQEWLIVEGTEAVGLIKAQSLGGKNLWKELQNFDGRGKALKMVPSRNKWGFDVQIDESEIGYWEQDKSSGVVLYGKTPSQTADTLDKITWDAVQVHASTIRDPKTSRKRGSNGSVQAEEVIEEDT